KDVRVNAEMGPAAGEKSVITKSGLKLGNDNLEINPKGQIKINDQQVNLEEGQALRMRDGSLVTKKNGRIKVDTKEYSLNFIPRANGQYLDVEAKTRGIGVVSDGVPPSGILGETFDGNYGRQTKSKFNPEAYRRVGLYN
ncbi:MAG: hypothetical protein K2X66_07195, partial [Cyanobacteria bacterium]|nr:hypothetical protein [Cyanobacteriota bacterium]